MPLGAATAPGALDALCVFANETAPRLEQSNVEGYALLTLPFACPERTSRQLVLALFARGRCQQSNAARTHRNRVLRLFEFGRRPQRYPTGEHGSPWDRAYARHHRRACEPALFKMLASKTLRAWFVMDHDSENDDPRNATARVPLI